MERIRNATRIELELMDSEQRRQLRKDYRKVVEDCEQWEREEDHKRICGHYSYHRAMDHFGRRAIFNLIEGIFDAWEFLTKKRNTDHLKQTPQEDVPYFDTVCYMERAGQYVWTREHADGRLEFFNGHRPPGPIISKTRYRSLKSEPIEPEWNSIGYNRYNEDWRAKINA